VIIFQTSPTGDQTLETTVRDTLSDIYIETNHGFSHIAAIWKKMQNEVYKQDITCINFNFYPNCWNLNNLV